MTRIISAHSVRSAPNIDVSSHTRHAARGFYNASHAPYGFHKVPVKDGEKTRYKLAPDPEDKVSVAVVRRMFDMAARGIGCKQIAVTLNNESFVTGTGKPWGRTTVHKVLTNEAYKGTLVYGENRGHPGQVERDSVIWIENAWPGIVEKDLFDIVQRKMASNSPRSVHPRTVSSFYLLTGCLYCACGSAMIGRSAKGHKYYYYERNRAYKQGKDAFRRRSIPKEQLERLIVGTVKSIILDPKHLGSWLPW